MCKTKVRQEKAGKDKKSTASKPKDGQRPITMSRDEKTPQDKTWDTKLRGKISGEIKQSNKLDREQDEHAADGEGRSEVEA